MSLGGWNAKLVKRTLPNSRRVAFAGLRDFKYFLGNDFGDRIGAVYQFKRAQGILVCRRDTTYLLGPECRTLQ